MKVTNMRLEYLKSPIGIQEYYPVFSWNVEETSDNWIQKAYQIQLGESYAKLEVGESIYNTGRILSKQMVNVAYEGEKLKSDTDYYWCVTVVGDNDDEVISEIASFRTGLYTQEDWKGSWIGEVEDHSSHLYRKRFALSKKVKRASLYICGLGHYECYMNGCKVSDRVLEPGWTNYHKSCLYSSYDVTHLLQDGGNVVGIWLGDGMFNVPGGRYVYFKRTFGKMKFLIQMNIYFEDDTMEQVVTDKSWKMADSPIDFCCIYGGEDYDARKEQEGFDKPDYIEGINWQPVVEVEAPEGELVSQKVEPVKVMKRYKPVCIEEVEGGFIYDLGTNFSGWVRVQISGKTEHCGHIITMTPGEILDIHKKPDQTVTGKGYHWQYTMNEKKQQEYTPKFTYTGFRYVLIEGAIPREWKQHKKYVCSRLPVVENLMGEFIYSSVEKTGEFTCSNPLFNQIHKIVTQAIESNMKSLFTDCPHREKLAWLEQTHLIGPGIMNNYGVHNLYEKIERDMEEAQYEKGLVPDTCPEYVVFGYHEGYVDSPEWGSACVINPWYLYKKYGDQSLFKKHYDTMRKYVDYLTSRTHHHILHHGLGDWLDIGPCPPFSQNTSVPIIATAIYYYNLCIMKEVSRLLGKEEDEVYYEKLRKEVYQEYNLQFYDSQTYRYGTGSQAAQGMSLVTGLVPEEQKEKVLKHLVRDIEAREYATTAGDIGHPFVIAALMMYGRSDVINKMTNVTDKPGYGYQVKSGATTLTEDWDGPNPNGLHGSQNHFMLGSIEEWFYSGLAGIGSIREDKEFDELVIRPHFAENCDEVRAWITHPYGKLAIHWFKKEKSISVKLTLPPNTTATFISEIDGSQMKLGSGYYEIELDWLGGKRDDK